MTRRSSSHAAVLGFASALGALGWFGCGSGTETRSYCDGAGCYTCDAYGCATDPNGPTRVPSGTTPLPSGTSTPGTTPPPKTCAKTSDCGSHESCAGGVCQTCSGAACACKTTPDCATGEVCVGGACATSAAICKFSSECGDGRVCADGACLASCESATCAVGFTCDKGVCNPARPAACTTDPECPPDAPHCASGACVKPCAADPECGTGKYCEAGACAIDTRPRPNCTSDAQCGAGGATPKKCVNGFCKYTCDTDQYCRTIDSRIGYCASDMVCRSASESTAECITSSTCAGGKVCVDNVCR